MKIFNNVQIPRIAKSFAIAAPLLFSATTINSKPYLVKDIFVKSAEYTNSTSIGVYSKAETPMLEVGGEDIYPAVVIDLSDGKLYQYDYEGYLEEVYTVATGKNSTPTKTGLRIITAIEDYPYNTAPRITKRYNNPDVYGPKVICLAPVDIKTGEILNSDGQFIHGTNDPNSIGEKASKGCVRMHNDDVEMLASVLDVGQYIYIQE